MNNVSWMNKLGCVEQLIHNVSLVNVFENWAPFDYIVQIAFHEFEWKINVHVIYRSENQIKMHFMSKIFEKMKQSKPTCECCIIERYSDGFEMLAKT